MSVDGSRLAHGERRESLLDAVAEMVSEGRVEDVSMESVADRAGVSRALVYKHFANRRELLSSLYQRESALLHVQLSAEVSSADGLAEMLRALVRGSLAAQAARGATFAALGSSGLRVAAQRGVQRRRDSQTLGYFARQAQAELGLDARAAQAGMAIVLGGISTVLAGWRLRPTPEHARLLEDTYVSLAMGGLKALAT